MPKPGQVAGARDIRKAERQRERRAKREEKLSKHRHQRERQVAGRRAVEGGGGQLASMITEQV